MKNGSEILTHLSLVLLLGITGIFLFRRRHITSSDEKLKRWLPRYAVATLFFMLVLAGAHYLEVKRLPTTTLGILILVALFSQIHMLVAGEKRLRNPSLTTPRDELAVCWLGLVTLLNMGLFVAWNSVVSWLLERAAFALKFNELNRDLFVWLRTPVALYFCQLTYEYLKPMYFKLKFQAKPIIEGPLHALVRKIAVKHRLDLKTLHGMGIERFGAHAIKGHGKCLYLTQNLRDALTEKEFEFLVVHSLIESQLKHGRQRMVHYLIFSVTLLLPYLLAVQTIIYNFTENWLVALWISLYAAMFLTQSFLNRRIETIQFGVRCRLARRLVKLSYPEMGALFQKFSSLNAPRARAFFLFQLPSAPALSVGNNKKPLRLWRKVAWRQSRRLLTPLATFCLGFTFLVTVVCVPLLKTKFELRAASASGEIERVKKLLSLKISADSVDILSNGMTPLLAASTAGHTQVVRLLLEKKANPNKKHPLKISPLLAASEAGHLDVAKELISAGANVNFSGYKGYTPLMLACRFGHEEVVRYLIDHGANVDARSKYLSTALMFSVQGGHFSIVKLLVQAGANPRLQDLDHESAIDMAKRRKLHQLISVMEQAHAHLADPAAARAPANKAQSNSP